MFVFGTLKLVNPISGWFHTQLITSGIGDAMFPFGVGNEILTGLILLVTLLIKDKLRARPYMALIILGSCMVVGTMIVAVYVHLQPNVPASVLPLGIKPPVIPISVLVLAVVNIFYAIKMFKTTSGSI
jgi:cytochrome c oxidase subunit IV